MGVGRENGGSFVPWWHKVNMETLCHGGIKHGWESLRHGGIKYI